MQLIRLVQGDDQSAPVPYLVVDPVAEKGYGVNMHMLLRYDAPIAAPGRGKRLRDSFQDREPGVSYQSQGLQSLGYWG